MCAAGWLAEALLCSVSVSRLALATEAELSLGRAIVAADLHVCMYVVHAFSVHA